MFVRNVFKDTVQYYGYTEAFPYVLFAQQAETEGTAIEKPATDSSIMQGLAALKRAAPDAWTDVEDVDAFIKDIREG